MTDEEIIALATSKFRDWTARELLAFARAIAAAATEAEREAIYIGHPPSYTSGDLTPWQYGYNAGLAAYREAIRARGEQ